MSTQRFYHNLYGPKMVSTDNSSITAFFFFFFFLFFYPFFFFRFHVRIQIITCISFSFFFFFLIGNIIAVLLKIRKGENFCL